MRELVGRGGEGEEEGGWQRVEGEEKGEGRRGERQTPIRRRRKRGEYLEGAVEKER